MKTKKDLELYLRKNKINDLNGSMNSVLMQDILETAIACIEENEKYRKALANLSKYIILRYKG